MINKLYWAYVAFTDIKGDKKRPVLLLRKTKENYIILRLSSKYRNKSRYIQSKYIKIQDWKAAQLPKSSWIDCYQVYELPIKTTKLKFIGYLSLSDLEELSRHIKL